MPKEYKSRFPSHKVNLLMACIYQEFMNIFWGICFSLSFYNHKHNICKQFHPKLDFCSSNIMLMTDV